MNRPREPAASAIQIGVEFRTNCIAIKYGTVSLLPQQTPPVIRILLPEEEGVIDADKPVISTMLPLVVEKVSDFVTLTTCNTLPTPVTPTRSDALVNTVPELSGKFSVRSVFVPGEAMVNVPVPEALPDRVILDNLVLLNVVLPMRKVGESLRVPLCK